MKTLLEQLTPETKQQLKEFKKTRPELLKSIEHDLMSVNYVSKLTYFTVLDLSELLNIDVTKYSNIRNLFIKD